MEIVLLGYFLINICQIFSLGGFLTNTTVVKVRVSVVGGINGSGSPQYRSDSLPRQYGSYSSMR
jgi:hypothetical protein